MWLTDFKIAIIEKNIDKLDSLMDEVPPMKSQKEIEEALYLINQATEIVSSLKNELFDSMQKTKSNLRFLNVTDTAPISKLNIKS
jgi:hypothetical protein